MRLKVKKFIRDREESRQRSKQGELELLATDKFKGRVDMLFHESHPLAEKASGCKHKRALGCKLPIIKRNRPECEACL